VIDTLLNLLFRCSHRRLTSPLTPVSKEGVAHSGTYVVCLDCGKQFDYDLKEMRIGKPIDHSHDACVVPRGVPSPPTKKVKYAVFAAVPVAIVIGAVLKSRKSGPKKNAPSGDEHSREYDRPPGLSSVPLAQTSVPATGQEACPTVTA
jgi:hypothetical protein